jgi:membrane fusion protein (multidrug efflux system)
MIPVLRIRPTAVLLTAAVLLSALGCKPSGAQSGEGRPAAMAFQVVAVEVRRQPVVESVPLVGTLAPNESIEVKSEAEGVVTRIAFDEGSRVAAGALLVALDQSKFAATLQESEAALELSRANLERAKQLLRDKLIPQQDFDQASATFNVNRSAVELRRRLLKDAEIFAPFAGTVGARQVSPGQVISKVSILTTLVDLETMKAELNVPERFLGQVSVGQKIDFRVDAFPADLFAGEIYFISPQLDPGTRTALVKARVPNPSGRLKAGMFAKLDLAVRLRESALVIPEPAILSSGDTNMVFIVGPQTNALMRPVKLGLRLAGKAEVLSGLAAGDTVVVEGVKKVFPGAPLRLAPPEAASSYR